MPFIWLLRYLILLSMTSYFSEPNNVKYLVPSHLVPSSIQVFIIPSILKNLIRKGFGLIKVLYEMSEIKLSCGFSSIKILSRLKFSNLMVSSK